MLNTCKDIISVNDDGCSNSFVGGGVVVVVICWLHSCMHARRMLLLLLLKVETKPTKVKHEVRTLDTSFKIRNTQKNTPTHKIFSEGLLFFVDQDFYISLVEAEKISQLQLNCQQNQSKTGRGMNNIISESKAFVFQAKNSSCLKDGVWWGSRPGGSSLQQG